MCSASCCTWNQTESQMYSVSFIYSGSDRNKLEVNVFSILLHLESNRVNVFTVSFIYLFKQYIIDQKQTRINSS